ncbi:hypothetical protein GOBAR_AA11343 [Gossypium barbadense]|uniref:Uncharacterized protein n=1 Tax=Gossypium barbadense TaxID=3634 RepID=A0A2P5Y165_GOSBA|nr:hypothetical protein GOBAR_AA11343 [Gossypium barbadense]
MPICCPSTMNHGITCLIATKIRLSIIFRTVSELEQAAGKNKNSRTRQGREEVSSGQKVGCLQFFEITHRKKDGSPMTSEAGEIMEKLKEKKAEYEAIASTDSSVNLENIDNRIITEVLGPERKYEELQQQLRAEAVAVAREAAIAANEAEAAAMAVEQRRKYDDLQQMM